MGVKIICSSCGMDHDLPAEVRRMRDGLTAIRDMMKSQPSAVAASLVATCDYALDDTSVSGSESGGTLES